MWYISYLLHVLHHIRCMHFKWPPARDLISLQVRRMNRNEKALHVSSGLSELNVCDGNNRRTCMSRTHCSTTAPVFLDAEASQQHAESSLPPTQLGMCYCSLVEEEECDFGRWSRCHIRQTLTTGVSGAVSSHLSVWNATGGPFLSETVFPRFSNSSYAACCIATGLPVHVCSCDAHSLQTLQSAT